MLRLELPHRARPVAQIVVQGVLPHLLGRIEADLLDNALQDSMQPPGSNVVDGGVDLSCDPRDFMDSILGEVQVHPLSCQQGLLLLDHVVLRLCEYSVEVSSSAARSGVTLLN